MKKEALFCDICASYIPDINHGIVLFKNVRGDGNVLERKIEHGCNHDGSICAGCIPSVAEHLKKWLEGKGKNA